MRFTLQELKNRSLSKPNGYYEEVLRMAEKINEDTYELSDDRFVALAAKYRLPGLMDMIKTLSKSIYRVSRDGLAKRSEEEIVKCLSICATCPLLVEREMRCGVCGCYLKAKVLLKTWDCPQNRWIKTEEDRSDSPR